MPPLILAHAGASSAAGPGSWPELLRAWEWSPVPLFALLLSAWIYRRGARRLRRFEVAAFWTGWWTLVVALVSPLHPWGKVLFSAHMTQHELLMVAAAPLLVLGRPGVAMLRALPKPDARSLVLFVNEAPLRHAWRWLTRPLVAWGVHAAALWLWHVPSLFQATLRNDFVHDLQHLSFFGSALIFWWALLHARPNAGGFGVAALYLFTTMAHTGALGALIAFANTVLYPAYAPGAARWSLSPLEDQQLGGFIMWVPAGLVYVVAALALVAGWLRQAERRYPAQAASAADRDAPGPRAHLDPA